MPETFKSIMHTADGQVIVKERPVPEIKEHFVLVENHFSTMSPGTHCSIVKRLRENPDPSGKSYTLGYSGAGIVREVGRYVEHVKSGDRVAIYGSPFTFEGEICLVPKLLCRRVQDNVSLEEASSVALGVIAMHAVRRAQVEMGSRVLVVGLGILGNLAAQFVEQSGGFCLAAGRSDKRRIALAGEMTKHTHVFSTLDESITGAVTEQFNGEKLDACIAFVTGAASLGEEIRANVRGRGRIVLGGGDIGLSVSNSEGVEQFILNSRAGGPGRGMAAYEQMGEDFPIEYVRFTEGRNMEAYLEMLARGMVQVKPLIDRVYPIEKGPEVYEQMIERSTDDIAPLFSFKK